MAKKREEFAFSRDYYEHDKKYFERIEKKTSTECWFKDYYNKVLGFSKKYDLILDCCCGTGIATAFLQKLRPKTIGTDFSKRFIKKATTRGKNFCVMDATRLAFRNNIFYMVCSADAIEHTPDLTNALSEMDRVLGKKKTVFS